MIEALTKHGWPQMKDLQGTFILNLILYDSIANEANEECRKIYYSIISSFIYCKYSKLIVVLLVVIKINHSTFLGYSIEISGEIVDFVLDFFSFRSEEFFEK